MSTTETASGKRSVKTLAIRLEPELHAQLSVIAQLRDSTISDEIRSALLAHIAATKTSSDLAARGQNVLEDIEREASSRREAIASLFGEKVEPPAPKGRRTAPA